MENGIYEAFCIEGGRKRFYQWDLNQKIIVNDRNIDEVHFCNGKSDCSLVCVVKDGRADVPNVLLQTAGNVRVYGYSIDHTVVEKIYEVKARTKPEDYVYTETEVLRYEALEKRISELEKNGGGTGGSGDMPAPYYITIEKVPDANGYKTSDDFDYAQMVNAYKQGRPIYITSNPFDTQTKMYAELVKLYDNRAIFAAVDPNGLSIITVYSDTSALINGGNVTYKGQRIVGAVNNIQPSPTSFLGGIFLKAADIPDSVLTVNGQTPDANGAVTVKNEPYYVNFTSADNTLAADFNYDEMVSAYKAGRNVYLVADGNGIKGTLSYIDASAVFVGVLNATWMNVSFISALSTKVEMYRFNSYTLPTMSESTKGGAKVGAGLKMEGEALTVDDGEYELVVDHVYTQEEISGLSVISHTETANGKPFFFKSVLLAVNLGNAPMDTDDNVKFCCSFSNQYWDNVVQAPWIQKGTENQSRWVEVYLDKGIWWSRWTGFAGNKDISSGYGMRNTSNLETTAEMYPAIKCVYWNANLFPAGTRIRIWGEWKGV